MYFKQKQNTFTVEITQVSFYCFGKKAPHFRKCLVAGKNCS